MNERDRAFALLRSLRMQLERLAPNDCCEKSTMKESTGRSTKLCIDSCPWSRMDLMVANMQVEMEILLEEKET